VTTTAAGRGWWSLVRPAFACYAVVRVVLLVETLASASAHHRPVTALLTTWDAHYYTSIAAYGYPSHVDIHVFSVIPFFPLYPLVGRALHLATHLPDDWLLLGVNWLAGVAMLVPAALLARDHWGEVRARRAAVLMAVFPGSAILGMTYADGLGTALACTCLLLLQRRRYLLAGIAGAAAGAAFSLASAALLAAILVFAVAQRQPKALLAGLVVPAGAAGYFGYLWVHTGSPLIWFRVLHAAWHAHLSLPTQSGTGFHDYAFAHPLVATVTALSIAAAVVAVAALVARRAPAHFFAYAVVVLAAATFNGTSHLTPRSLFDAFPAVLALGASIPRWLVPLVAVLGVVGIAGLFYGYSLQNFTLLAP
jgi:hypothetical protein